MVRPFECFPFINLGTFSDSDNEDLLMTFSALLDSLASEPYIYVVFYF